MNLLLILPCFPSSPLEVEPRGYLNLRYSRSPREIRWILESPQHSLEGDENQPMTAAVPWGSLPAAMTEHQHQAWLASLGMLTLARLLCA